MRTYSACIEMLFSDESADFAGRIALARDAGLSTIEFWRWTNKDLDRIEAALRNTGMAVAGIVAEPMIALTDPANADAFVEGLARSVEVAQRLGAGTLIAQAGNDLEGLTREAQRDSVIATLRRAVPVLDGSGVRLGLEPLNTRVDHPGYFLSSTTESLDIVDAVGDRAVGITYDLYHSAVMDERPEEVLAGRVDRVAHVHVADHPGRHEPGSGGLDLRTRLDWVVANGYAGPIGLEYRPAGGSSATLPGVLAALG